MEYQNDLTQRIAVNNSNESSANTSGNSNNYIKHADSGHAVHLTACYSKMDKTLFIHKWNITQFSIQQDLSSPGEFIESSIFGTSNGDYKFRLKMFPCGKDEECKGYLSLFLQITKCPTPKLRFRVNFYIDSIDGPKGCALNKNIVTINRGGIVTASKFFSIDTLKARATKFLPDDVLTVSVELTVFGDVCNREVLVDEEYFHGHELLSLPRDSNSSFITEHRLSDDSCNSLNANLGWLFESGDFSDFMIHVGRHSFKCHRAILIARSPFFQAMFRDPNNQESTNNEAKLEDISPETASSVLEFIYKDSCAGITEQPVDLLAAADRFCLDRLKWFCQEQLSKDINMSNVCERLRLADLYNAPKLRQKVIFFICRHLAEILDSQEWRDLEAENPSLAANVLRVLITQKNENPHLLECGVSTSYEHKIPTKRARLT